MDQLYYMEQEPQVVEPAPEHQVAPTQDTPEPAPQAPAETSSNNIWYWVLGGAAVLYLLNGGDKEKKKKILQEVAQAATGSN